MKRFWLKVVRTDDCWLWTGAKNPYGYGKLTFARRTVSAHRFAYEEANGPIADRRMFVCHRCDNPSCVRPEHLFLGSRNDNMADMKQKGRWDVNGKRTMPKGEAHHMAKLTDEEIGTLKAVRAAGLSYRQIATSFGIAPSTAYQVITGLRRAV